MWSCGGGFQSRKLFWWSWQLYNCSQLLLMRRFSLSAQMPPQLKAGILCEACQLAQDFLKGFFTSANEASPLPLPPLSPVCTTVAYPWVDFGQSAGKGRGRSGESVFIPRVRSWRGECWGSAVADRAREGGCGVFCCTLQMPLCSLNTQKHTCTCVCTSKHTSHSLLCINWKSPLMLLYGRTLWLVLGSVSE